MLKRWNFLKTGFYEGIKVISANQAALDLFGFHGEDAIGSDVGERFSDATDRESFRRNVAEAGSVRDFEVKLVRKDGTVMDCLMTASRRFDETGRNAGLQGTIRNITERKLVERTHRDLAVVGERNRMAREIHDTLAQGFTGIVLQLEAAEQAFDQSPEEAAEYLTKSERPRPGKPPGGKTLRIQSHAESTGRPSFGRCSSP